MWRDGAATPGGFGLWEVGTTDDSRPERRLLVLAAAGRYREVSAWTWSGGDTTMPPLARHLMYAATVRYQLRVRIAAGGPLAELDLLSESAATALSEQPDRLLRGKLAAASQDRQLRDLSALARQP